MNELGSLFRIENIAEAALIGFAAILLAILIISFRSRAVVFCQYLEAMTGVRLATSEVRRVFRERGKTGVRETLLDLLIRQDFEEEGPVQIPSREMAPEGTSATGEPAES